MKAYLWTFIGGAFLIFGTLMHHINKEWSVGKRLPIQ